MDTRFPDATAPGEGVYVVNPNGSNQAVSGTSFAAPAVAGIAGLIADFDPRLPADSIKQILIAGAVAGGRTAGAFPVANAYESLKKVASRVGGPICGNRVFIDPSLTLQVERRTTLSAFTDDAILTLSNITFRNLVQDGRYLDIGENGTPYTLVFRDGGWHKDPEVDHEAAGRPWSNVMYPASSFAADSYFVADQRVPLNPNPQFKITVYDTAGASHIVANGIPGVVTGGAYPKNGKEILVAVAASNSFGIPEDILGVNIATGAIRTIYTRPGNGSLNITLYTTEGGDEFVMEYTGPSPDYTTCYAQYRSVATGALLRTIEKPQSQGCNANQPTDLTVLKRGRRPPGVRRP